VPHSFCGQRLSYPLPGISQGCSHRFVPGLQTSWGPTWGESVPMLTTMATGGPQVLVVGWSHLCHAPLRGQLAQWKLLPSELLSRRIPRWSHISSFSHAHPSETSHQVHPDLQESQQGMSTSKGAGGSILVACWHSCCVCSGTYRALLLSLCHLHRIMVVQLPVQIKLPVRGLLLSQHLELILLCRNRLQEEMQNRKQIKEC
jgi:hypothetical protein